MSVTGMELHKSCRSDRRCRRITLTLVLMQAPHVASSSPCQAFCCTNGYYTVTIAGSSMQVYCPYHLRLAVIMGFVLLVTSSISIWKMFLPPRFKQRVRRRASSMVMKDKLNVVQSWFKIIVRAAVRIGRHVICTMHISCGEVSVHENRKT